MNASIYALLPNMNTTSDETDVSVSFQSINGSISSSSELFSSTDSNSIFSGTAYSYPSPAPGGTTDIGFRIINATMHVALELFDSVGSKIYKKELTEYPVGYNTIEISPDTIGYQLPTGVYYFVLTDQDGELLSKGKFAAIPGGNS